MKRSKKYAMFFAASALAFSVYGCSGAEKTADNDSSADRESSARAESPGVVCDSDFTADGTDYISTGTDENAILVTGGNVKLDDIGVTRTSDDSSGGDDASFYGVGAAILAKGGTATIENADIVTDSKGGAGVFAYGDGIVNIGNSSIKTKQDASGGIHVAGGGTLYADNVNAETDGESSAAVRSDRGGGLMVVTGGSYTSNGTGSPAVYSTANIVCKEAELTSNNSEAVCIEGLNSLYLYDCDLSGNMKDLSQNDCTWNVILYQSMSGDSVEGNSTFQMSGGTLTAKNGGMFYTTNTESTFILRDVDINYAEDNDFFLRCTGNNNSRGWGRSGENGADCSFTATDQEMSGDVIWDSISGLDFYMTGSSSLTGAFVRDDSYAGDGGSGYANLTIGSGSEWTVTGDSTLTALHNGGKITDESGNSVTIKSADGTVFVRGDSEYTVTVSSYDTAADTSEASEVADFEDVQINNGSQSSPAGMGGAEAPPEKPDGEAPDDGNPPPEMPSGEAPDGGNPPPEMPGGEAPDDGNPPPEKPDGEAPDDGNPPPEMPSGEAPADAP